MGTELIYNGEIIHLRDDKICLTDMWKASGADLARQPAKWLGSAEAKNFTTELAKKLNLRNSEDDLILRVRGGISPSTWGHWQIAIAYAQYLSPEFHIWCNEVVRAEMMEREYEGRINPKPIDFEIGDISPETRRIVGGIVRDVVAKQLREMLEYSQAFMKEQMAAFRAELLSRSLPPPVAGPVMTMVSAYEVINIMVGIEPQKIYRGLPKQVSDRLLQFCAQSGFKTVKSIVYPKSRSRREFQREGAEQWLQKDGRNDIRRMVADKWAKKIGQGSLNLKVVKPS